MVAIALVVIYAVVVLAIVTRFDRPSKKGPKITGRGGDFE
jgi:hypothetical protein